MDTNKKLRITLQANAIFSTISGLALTLFSRKIAAIIQIGQPLVLFFIGIALLLFAGTVWWSGTYKSLNTKQIKFIILQDWLWVAGSVAIIVLQAFGVNTLGYIIIGVVALIVADFALLQGRFLRKLKRPI